jgi:hypothetical protein
MMVVRWWWWVRSSMVVVVEEDIVCLLMMPKLSIGVSGNCPDSTGFQQESVGDSKDLPKAAENNGHLNLKDFKCGRHLFTKQFISLLKLLGSCLTQIIIHQLMISLVMHLPHHKTMNGNDHELEQVYGEVQEGGDTRCHCSFQNQLEFCSKLLPLMRYEVKYFSECCVSFCFLCFAQ